MHSDKKLIASHGGPTRLAELLGYDTKNGGVQRVGNWARRGIPSEVKLEHPSLFPAESRKRQKAA